jgi:predicted GH43/DUF377 family glycosyl hydrolase
VLRDDGDTLHLHYGAADDSVVCVAEASLAKLLRHLSDPPAPRTLPACLPLA